MSPSTLKDMLDDRATVKTLTVDQYHTMIEAGILESGEPLELLNGVIMSKDRSQTGNPPMTVNPAHTWTVQRFAQMDAQLMPQGCHIRTQQPLTLPPRNEPEPDVAIVRGTIDDFAKNHPYPADILCVIEVADASLRRDRTVKLSIYAQAGIAEYFIVNLADKVIEHYTEPAANEERYARMQTITCDESFSLPTANERLTVEAAQVFAV